MGDETPMMNCVSLRQSINFDEKDNLGRTGLTGEAHFAIPMFLGSYEKREESVLRPWTQRNFQKYTGSISRVTRLPGQMY